MTKPQPVILVVDDQPHLLKNLGLTLEAEGYEVLTAADGPSALALLQNRGVNLILADIAMPRMNGYQFYERVRANEQWVSIPFVFLTARALDSDVRYGKELGADDYLVKPIEPEDLLAVVRGKLRRARQLAEAAPAPAARQAMALGHLEIDPAQHRVRLNGAPVALSAREFALLAHLAERPGEVVPPEEIVLTTHQLQTDAVEAGALLRPLIRSLRRKLGYGVGEMGCIENVRGVGYRLVPPAA